MAYLDVIPLSEAKTYLRVDDTLTDDDARITSMIKAVLSSIERRTNILVYAREKSYLFQDYCVSVYDYPINEVLTPKNVDEDEKILYTNFYANSLDDKKLTLNVGYEDPEDVPDEIIECALEYLKYFYYDAETNNGTAIKIPLYVENMINEQKRFII